jgi:hypothetical protein
LISPEQRHDLTDEERKIKVTRKLEGEVVEGRGKWL